MNALDALAATRDPSREVHDFNQFELEGLVERFQRKEASIGVVGLGYVGLPLALAVSECGFRVIGYDLKEDVVASINYGQSPLHHIDDERIAAMRHEMRIEA